jgi:hypothetical protein
VTGFGTRAWRRALGALIGAAVLITSCGSPERKPPGRPSLLESARTLAAPSGPEWRYHPRRAAQLERYYELGPGLRLFVGAAGERWVADTQLRRAKPAAMLAPEALVGALSPARTAWVFVGRSGTTYDTDSPTGGFVSSSSPLVDMAKVDSGLTNILGVSRDGQLWLSEDAGLGWRQVGPSGARFADVMIVPPNAMALEVPERLWWSSDEGRSWQALAQPPFGARGLARDEEAGPVLVSVLGIQALAFAEAPVLTPLQRALKPAEPELGFSPELGPSARALARGRGFVHGGRYFEVVLGAKAETLSGPLMAQLERRSAPVFSACTDARAAGFERWVYVACTRERSGSARQFEFFRSEDGGQTFEREPYVGRADPELARLAVGRGGDLLVTGFCASAENVAGCRPQGIQRRHEQEGDAGAAVALGSVAAPALEEHARALAFSSDGTVAYAVGARTKGDSLFAFVSTDLDRGFAARPLAALDGSEWRGPTEVIELTASSEGPLSLVLAQPSGAQRLVVLDAGARTLSVNVPPVDAALVGASGNRALAVSPESVWESLNGGAEWENLGRLPRSICAAASGRCALAVHCEAEGCTLGESLSRVGWRGHEPPSATLPPSRAARSSIPPRRALGPGWSCESSNTEWAELRGVERLPDAAQASLGKAAWFALSTDDTSASAGLWIAETSSSTERGVKLRYSELLAPAARAADMAYHATHQVEGAAALRYRVPGAQATPGGPIREIEVAWENLLDGQHERALLPDAGNALPGDFVKGDGPARRAQPDLVSIASGGVFVRVHRQPQHEQLSYFLDGTSVQTLPALRWSVTPPKEASLEMARLGGESVHLAFVDQGGTVVRASRRGDSWRFDAMAIGYHDLGNFSIEQHRDVAYARGRAGIHLTSRRSDGSAQSQLFPLQADGPVLGAPLGTPAQRDIGDVPVACTPEQRTDTPRVIAPYQPGRRRPLVVIDPVEPVRVFLSDAAVLHGTPERPCAAAFDAELVKSSSGTSSARERALLSLDGPSWLFRVTVDNSRRDARVEYRTMSCHPDPAVEVPSEVYDMPGTDRNE